MYCICCKTAKSVRNCLVLNDMSAKTCKPGFENCAHHSVSCEYTARRGGCKGDGRSVNKYCSNARNIDYRHRDYCDDYLVIIRASVGSCDGVIDNMVSGAGRCRVEIVICDSP